MPPPYGLPAYGQQPVMQSEQRPPSQVARPSRLELQANGLDGEVTFPPPIARVAVSCCFLVQSAVIIAILLQLPVALPIYVLAAPIAITCLMFLVGVALLFTAKKSKIVFHHAKQCMVVYDVYAVPCRGDVVVGSPPFADLGPMTVYGLRALTTGTMRSLTVMLSWGAVQIPLVQLRGPAMGMESTIQLEWATYFADLEAGSKPEAAAWEPYVAQASQPRDPYAQPAPAQYDNYSGTLTQPQHGHGQESPPAPLGRQQQQPAQQPATGMSYSQLHQRRGAHTAAPVTYNEERMQQMAAASAAAPASAGEPAAAEASERGASSAAEPTQPAAAAEHVPEGGDWVLDAESGYYWSEAEQYYTDPTNGHYYDPQTGQWWDPVSGEWYEA
jgi:hypothetical protein